MIATGGCLPACSQSVSQSPSPDCCCCCCYTSYLWMSLSSVQHHVPTKRSSIVFLSHIIWNSYLILCSRSLKSDQHSSILYLPSSHTRVGMPANIYFFITNTARTDSYSARRSVPACPCVKRKITVPITIPSIGRQSARPAWQVTSSIMLT